MSYLNAITASLHGEDGKTLHRRAAVACFINSVLGIVVPITLLTGPDMLPWVLALAVLAIQAFVLLALTALLSRQFDYRGGNAWLLAMMSGLLIVVAVLVADNPITAPIGEWFFLASLSLLVYGLFQTVLLVKLLRWGQRVHGLLNIYCAISVAGCTLCGTIVLSWLGVPVLVAAEITLGVLFLRAARTPDTSDCPTDPDTPNSKNVLTNTLLAIQLFLFCAIVLVPLVVFALGGGESGTMLSSALYSCFSVAIAVFTQLALMVAMLFQRPSALQKVIAISTGLISAIMLMALGLLTAVLILAGPLD